MAQVHRTSSLLSVDEHLDEVADLRLRFGPDRLLGLPVHRQALREPLAFLRTVEDPRDTLNVPDVVAAGGLGFL